MIEFWHDAGDRTPVVELIPDRVVFMARALCLCECRAGICQDAARCLNSWPGESAGFGDMIKDAYRGTEIKPRYRVKARGGKA